jgi:hypothetical protein
MGQGVARKNLGDLGRIIGQGDAQTGGKRMIDRNQPRGCDRGRGLPREETLGQARIAVVEGELGGHAVSFGQAQ